MDYYEMLKSGTPISFNEDNPENIINELTEAVWQLEAEGCFDYFDGCNNYLKATYDVRYSDCGNEFVENHFPFFHELENRHPKIAVLQFIRSYTDNRSYDSKEWLKFLILLKIATSSDELEELIEVLRKNI